LLDVVLEEIKELEERLAEIVSILILLDVVLEDVRTIIAMFSSPIQIILFIILSYFQHVKELVNNVFTDHFRNCILLF
jgi:hypothetical protein